MALPKTWQELATEAKELPSGHIKKFEAKAAIAKEYSKCHHISSIWMKRIRKNLHYDKKYWLNYLTNEQAVSLCKYLADTIGEKKPLKQIVAHSTEVATYAAAHYNGITKSIHFKYDPWLDTLIHEFAHHCCRDDVHGEKYCITLEIIFQVLYEYLTGKKIKPDW